MPSAAIQRIPLSVALPASLRGGVVAIGNFDGVHRGHQAVLQCALAEAERRGAPALVLTFEPHPRLVFRPEVPLFRITTAPVRARLLEALGFAAPAFAHLPLISDAEGQGLSKRIGSLSLESLRESGLEPLAIASLLLRLGQGEPPEPCLDWPALVDAFDIAKFGHATPRLSEDDLTAMNAKLLHALPYQAVADRLHEGTDAAVWEAVKGNIQRLAEVADWQRIVAGQLDTSASADAELLEKAVGLLPPEPWDASTWKAWTKAVQEATGRKGKALFLPLRLALTGREHGPELANLLPLIGRKRVLERLCRR